MPVFFEIDPLFAYSFLVWITYSNQQKSLGRAVGWLWFVFTGGFLFQGPLFKLVNPCYWTYKYPLERIGVGVAALYILGALLTQYVTLPDNAITAYS